MKAIQIIKSMLRALIDAVHDTPSCHCDNQMDNYSRARLAAHGMRDEHPRASCGPR